MTVKDWKIKSEYETDPAEFAKQLEVTDFAAKVLLARGFTEQRKAFRFIHIHCYEDAPLNLKDMDKAVARINKAIDGDETVAIFGDYDADGLTATTLMFRCLTGFGLRVFCALPSREGSGYGLSSDIIDSFKEYGVSLIITVDNGVSAFDEVDYANSLGMDVVVTDHHVVHEKLPNAVAVVNPHRPDDETSFKDLAGVGVALKLAASLEGITFSDAVDEYGLLAAIGTIGDVMPLMKENRFIVKIGIDQLKSCEDPGLVALCDISGVDREKADEGCVAYTIVPRLNAAGRMGTAETSLRLLLSEDYDEALEVAKELEQINRQRQVTEQETREIISKLISQTEQVANSPVIVVAGEDFHSGVMGIACSRLVEKYNRPVIIISVEGDVAKGSGRSVSGFSLYGMIEYCSDLLEKYGGHDMAAGFTLKTEKLDAFRTRILQYCRENADAYQVPVLNIDAIVDDIGEITEENVQGLRRVAPFGSANKEPVFLLKGMKIEGIYPMGEKHSRLNLSKNGKRMYAALFGESPSVLSYAAGDVVDVAVSFSIYNGQNRTMVSTKIIDIRPSSFRQLDIDTYKDARRYLFSGKIPEDSPVRATRTDAAVIYRKIRSAPISQSYSQAVSCSRFDGQPLGRVMLMVRVFTELGLVREMTIDGKPMIAAVPNAPKRDLKESDTFMSFYKES